MKFGLYRFTEIGTGQVSVRKVSAQGRIRNLMEEIGLAFHLIVRIKECPGGSQGSWSEI
jgi:hypothetical protein